ncbi:MAG: chloride channel protein, partial [Firmicutes bacterium]|nr:chloride channel protein [Bacillota bacterium]
MFQVNTQSWRARLSAQLSSPYREPAIIGVLALAIGIIGGLGAIIFRDLIRVFYTLFHAGGVQVSPLRALIPAVGLTIVGLITHYFAKEVKGHGVPQILESLALRGGKIRPRVAFFGILAPAITIGAGGSVGREGPIALIGGAFGSIVGQALRLSDKYTSLLLACGSAAGIAATFNAPIAGGFFGLEVILGSYSMGAIMPVFLSAVTGATVFDAIMGSQPPLQTAPYHVMHPIALLFMIVLGALAGFLGLAYSRGLTWIEDVFNAWRVPFWVKTSLGGLLVGAIGLAFPQVLGVGYPSIHAALSGQLAIGLLLVLFLTKYIATLTTVGSGGSGGVFAPSLFLGSVVGAAFGEGLRKLLPGLVPHPQIYAIAGMGAIFAAAAQAPFVAITILLEVTGDYQLTPVVMAACVTAYVVHGVLSRDSMYTVKLARRGIRILSGNEVRPTERILVRTAMEPLDTSLELADTVEKAF